MSMESPMYPGDYEPWKILLIHTLKQAREQNENPGQLANKSQGEPNLFSRFKGLLADLGSRSVNRLISFIDRGPLSSQFTQEISGLDALEPNSAESKSSH